MGELKAVVASLALASIAQANAIQQHVSKTQPNWFQTSPDNYAGTIETGAAPFLAQINPAPFGQATYVPNAPLETSEPIKGANGRNIFHLMGDQSPYFPSQDGFGVDEYPLPRGANITHMHMLQRHGSRYPSSSEGLSSWAAGITNATQNGTVFKGALEFMNDWTYGLGEEILVPIGRKELFDSGILNYYNYGHLYDNSSKIVVRTTLQARMLESCENFLAGFFGLNWRKHANILATVDSAVTGDYACTNEGTTMAESIETPVATWMETYLKTRTAHLRTLTGSYDWTVIDTYHAQSLCPYETISLGYSPFCELFSYEEWKGYEYLMDIEFAAISGFLSPTGRAQGKYWVEEFLARVEGHFVNVPASDSGNITLDTNPVTFPLNQSLYFEFTHDANIIAVLTAFGLTQFSDFLPLTGPPKDQQFIASQLVPFAGRLNIEIIKAPHKVSTKRSSKQNRATDYVSGTEETYYVHFIQNQRTIPLHASFKACEYRDDGWCELSTFLEVQRKNMAEAEYKYACFGNWTVKSYGTVRNGVPA